MISLVVLSFIFVINSNATHLTYSLIGPEESYELGSVYPFTQKFSAN